MIPPNTEIWSVSGAIIIDIFWRLEGAGVPADLDPLPKLSENIVLNVLVKKDDTLRSSAY